MTIELTEVVDLLWVEVSSKEANRSVAGGGAVCSGGFWAAVSEASLVTLGDSGGPGITVGVADCGRRGERRNKLTSRALI